MSQQGSLNPPPQESEYPHWWHPLSDETKKLMRPKVLQYIEKKRQRDEGNVKKLTRAEDDELDALLEWDWPLWYDPLEESDTVRAMTRPALLDFLRGKGERAGERKRKEEIEGPKPTRKEAVLTLFIPEPAKIAEDAPDILARLQRYIQEINAGLGVQDTEEEVSFFQDTVKLKNLFAKLVKELEKGRKVSANSVLASNITNTLGDLIISPMPRAPEHLTFYIEGKTPKLLISQEEERRREQLLNYVVRNPAEFLNSIETLTAKIRALIFKIELLDNDPLRSKEKALSRTLREHIDTLRKLFDNIRVVEGSDAETVIEELKKEISYTIMTTRSPRRREYMKWMWQPQEHRDMEERAQARIRFEQPFLKFLRAHRLSSLVSFRDFLYTHQNQLQREDRESLARLREVYDGFKTLCATLLEDEEEGGRLEEVIQEHADDLFGTLRSLGPYGEQIARRLLSEAGAYERGSVSR